MSREMGVADGHAVAKEIPVEPVCVPHVGHLPDGSGTEVLVTVWKNGRVTVALRPVGVRTWGPPAMLEQAP